MIETKVKQKSSTKEPPHTSEKPIPLTVPNLYPDELLQGHVGRLGIRNGFEDYFTTKDTLRKLFVTYRLRHYEYPVELQISELQNSPIESIVKNHTMIPLTRSLLQIETPNDDLHNLVIRRNTSAKQHFYFCESCIKEDIEFHGESYWRRSHQINGVEICTKHQKLRFAAKDQFAYFYPPDKVLKSKKFIKNDVSFEDLKNPIIMKYNELIEDYIHLNKPLHFKAISQLLASHAKAKQLRVQPRGYLPTLSKFIFENVPNTWLVKNFNCYWRKKTVDYIHEIDSVFISSFPSSLFSYLLAIATLIPNCDSQILLHDKFTLSKNYKSVGDDGILDEELINSYENNKGDYARIVIELNKPRHIIESRLKKLGLPPLGQFHNKTRRALQDYFNGTPMYELYDQNGVNFEQIFDALRISSKLRDINFI